MFFSKRLKKEIELKGEDGEEMIPLNVDLYQTDDEIVIYASLPGVSLEDVHVFIRGNNDTVVVLADSRRPENLVYESEKPKGKYLAEDIIWGRYYRKIILPVEISVSGVEARLKNGILILRLPFLEANNNETGFKIQVVELDDSAD